MAKKSVSDVSKEVNGKRVRGLEAKSGTIVITLADGTELKLSSERGSDAVAVEYGETEEAALTK